jgi:nucleoid-associated protein YgaU
MKNTRKQSRTQPTFIDGWMAGMGLNPQMFQSNATRNKDISAGKGEQFPPGTILRMGSRGELVERLQRALVSQGFPIVVDCVYGYETESTVRKFQQICSLDIDGVASDETLKRLGRVSSSGSNSQETVGRRHVVRAGENLSRIAELHYGDSTQWPNIAEANKLTNPSILAVGQSLLLPGLSELPESKVAEDSTMEVSHGLDTVENHVHIVFPGENLWSIASKYYNDSSRWSEIARFNELSMASVIQVGQRLIIPNAAGVQADSETENEEHMETEHGFGEDVGNTTEVEDSPNTLAPSDPIALGTVFGMDRTMAEIYNDKGRYLKRKSSALGISAASAAAVLKVESGGKGFSDSGKMIIRFENHIFWEQWGRSNPEQFNRHFRYSSNKSWEGHRFRPNEQSPWQSFHGNQPLEWEVLNFATQLSDTAAKQSISMGAAQIMGFNYRTLGYSSVQEMFSSMSGDLVLQIDGMFEFIKNKPICINGLRNADYYSFASGYNGSANTQVYGPLISTAAASYAKVTAGRSQA